MLDPPPTSNLLQQPGDALTEVSGLFVGDVLLNLHTWTHRTTDQSDDEDSEGTLEEDAIGVADYVDHETDDGEDVAMEGDADPREGIVSDWDILAEESIVEAEELGEFSISDHDLDILRPFGMKIRNNLTASIFHETSYNFPKRARRVLPRRDFMFGCSPALSP